MNLKLIWNLSQGSGDPDRRQGHRGDSQQPGFRPPGGEGNPGEDQQAGSLQVSLAQIYFNQPGNLHSRLMAEITEVTRTTNKMLEEQLGPSLAVARTVIDYGQKDRNPVVI